MKQPQITLVPVNSGRNGLDALELGRLDAVMLTEVSYRYQTVVRDWDYSHFHQVLFLGELEFIAWVHKDHASDTRFNTLKSELDAMHEDGTANAYMAGIGVDFQP